MNDIMIEVKEQLLKRGAEVFSVSGTIVTFALSGQVYSIEIKWLGGQTTKPK